MDSSNKPKIYVAVIAVLAILIWNQNYRGDTAPLSSDYSMAVFENSFLTSSDGDRITSYCFGLGGGIERSHPCVYIVNYYGTSSDELGKNCYILSYLPEANYGSTYMEIPSNQRFYPYDSTPFDVTVCGEFEVWDGSERGDGRNIDDWIFRTDSYPSEIISADLKARGYQW